MVFPLIGYIIVAVISFLCGTAAVVLKWDDIIVALKGKKLAVLGAREVGKTHLINFLSTGSIPTEYRQTAGAVETPKRRFQLKELDLKLKETLDVAGDKGAYAEWKKLFDEADVVFYLLMADRLFVGDAKVEVRVRDDLKHIGEWLEARSPRPRFFIIGTHCDLDDEFLALSADRIGSYRDKFQELPVVKELVARGGGHSQTKVILGSMKTIQDTEKLVYGLFLQVNSHD